MCNIVWPFLRSTHLRFRPTKPSGGQKGIHTGDAETSPTLLRSQMRGFVGICIKADISSSFICEYELRHLSMSANASGPCCHRLKSHRWSSVMYDNMQNLSHISVVWSEQWRGGSTGVPFEQEIPFPAVGGNSRSEQYPGHPRSSALLLIALVPFHWKKTRKNTTEVKRLNRKWRICWCLDCCESFVSHTSFTPSHLQKERSFTQSHSLLGIRQWQCTLWSTRHTSNRSVIQH